MANYDFTLRPVTCTDLPALLALEDELFGVGAWSYDMLAEEIATSDRHYIAATTQSVGAVGVDRMEKLVGYGGIALRTSAEIMTVGVARVAQNKGVGRALMRELLVQAHQHEADEVFLEVRVDNAAAISLYRSLGFADVRIRRGYYQPENIDALVMRRK